MMFLSQLAGADLPGIKWRVVVTNSFGIKLGGRISILATTEIACQCLSDFYKLDVT